MVQTQLGPLVRETEPMKRSAQRTLGDLYMEFPAQMASERCKSPSGKGVAQIARLSQDGLSQTLLAIGIDGPRPARALAQFQAAETESLVVVQPALHGGRMLPKSMADLRHRAAFRGPQNGTKAVGVSDVARATQVVFDSRALFALESGDEQNRRHGKPSRLSPTPSGIVHSVSFVHSFRKAT
jgi:hypothetical protein